MIASKYSRQMKPDQSVKQYKTLFKEFEVQEKSMNAVFFKFEVSEQNAMLLSIIMQLILISRKMQWWYLHSFRH